MLPEDKELLEYYFPGCSPWSQAQREAVDIAAGEIIRCGWPRDSPELRCYHPKRLATRIAEAIEGIPY